MIVVWCPASVLQYYGVITDTPALHVTPFPSLYQYQYDFISEILMILFQVTTCTSEVASVLRLLGCMSDLNSYIELLTILQHVSGRERNYEWKEKR